MTRFKSRVTPEGHNPQEAEPHIDDQDWVACTLKGVSCGKAVGPWLGVTNTYKTAGLTRDNNNDELTYLPTITRLIEHVSSGRIPPHLQQAFSLTYFLTVYKDLDDLMRLCPIKVGTALHHLVAAHLCTIYQHNWTICVRGGTDFIINTTQAQVDRSVNPQDDSVNDATGGDSFLNPRHLPTWALVSLDIKNTFNSVSRKCCSKILVECFPGLVPFFDTLYMRANKCNYS